jgi:hypothetical protein
MKTKPEYFDPDKYPCWLTGYGSGRFGVKSEEKTEGKARAYLNREKDIDKVKIRKHPR